MKLNSLIECDHYSQLFQTVNSIDVNYSIIRPMYFT